MKKFAVVYPLVIVVVSFFVGLYFLPLMPDSIASHWGANGEVNGYSSKTFGLFFMPILIVFLYGLFRILPKTDPYHKNFKQFSQYFDQFIVVIFTFLFYIHMLTIYWNLGYRFNFIQFLLPALSILFFFTGTLIEKSHRNWFVGIRTPWTLSSDEVWNKTHLLGGKLFKIVAALSLVGMFAPSLSFYFVMFPVLSATLFIYFYSYWVFSKKGKR
jgi:uncharacterized membrane protein